MKFNYQFPTQAAKHWDAWIGSRDLADVAVAAEDNGFDLVSATDHPLPTEAWVNKGGHHSFDPFVALAFMAAATTRIRLLTFVLVAGYRNPFITAKAAASLDVLSKGRLIAGMGSGYQRDEFKVLGASFGDRGPRFDAAIAAMRRAWTGEVIEEDDDYYPARGHIMRPRPAQRPGPPIWVGGNSNAAIRRVSAIADGWLPFAQPAEMAAITATPKLDVDDLSEKIERIRTARIERGRDPFFEVCFTPRPLRGADESADATLALIPQCQEIGVTHLSIESKARSMDACQAEIELYGQRVIGAGSTGMS